jgi:hypothetical protein
MVPKVASQNEKQGNYPAGFGLKTTQVIYYLKTFVLTM